MRTTSIGRRAAVAAGTAALALSAACSVLQPGGPGAAPTAARTTAGSKPSTPTTTGTATPSGEPSPVEHCGPTVAKLTVEQQVGQLLMVGVGSTSVTDAQSKALAGSLAGSVFLRGNSTLGLTRTASAMLDLRAATVHPTAISVIVAADQEGGRIQRLSGTGFAVIPSAVGQATFSDTELADRSTEWATELDDAGVNVNLAPVADVVPTALRSTNQPIGVLHRSYGSSPAVVARKVGAVVTGTKNAGVGTAVKHFPGLGRVRGNTDTTAHVVDTVTTRHDVTLAGFKTAVDRGTAMVMVSSAYYRRIDPTRRAALSPTIIKGMLRGDLGFTGVVVSDDLSAAAMADLTPGVRAIRFVNAGGDLAAIGQPQDVMPTVTALVARAKSDPAFAARITESATRVVGLKAQLGLARCV